MTRMISEHLRAENREEEQRRYRPAADYSEALQELLADWEIEEGIELEQLPAHERGYVVGRGRD